MGFVSEEKLVKRQLALMKKEQKMKNKIIDWLKAREMADTYHYNGKACEKQCKKEEGKSRLEMLVH